MAMRKLTLTEALVLLAIIVIIGYLIVILGLQFRGPWRQAKLTRCKINLKAIGAGAMTYKSANRERPPVMGDRPTTDAGVNLSPTSDNGSDVKYGEPRADGTIEDWSALGDNGMQNVWLMISSAVVEEKAFDCPGDTGHKKRRTDFQYGWTSPNQYSYSIQWPYARSAAGDTNPAAFNAKLEDVVIFADRNPGGRVSEDRPRNHGTLGIDLLWMDGSVETYNDVEDQVSLAGYGNDDIYTNALGIAGGFPQNPTDTSLNLSPR
jgi:hypothetical protein